jgi:hypothetical protein
MWDWKLASVEKKGGMIQKEDEEDARQENSGPKRSGWWPCCEPTTVFCYKDGMDFWVWAAVAGVEGVPGGRWRGLLF